MKKKLFAFIVTAFMLIGTIRSQQIQVSKPTIDAPYPKIRVYTTPSRGETPLFNSPSFQWPSTKKATYSVRLSMLKDFNSNLIEKTGIPFAIFNPHKELELGKWYWQYKTNDGAWNAIDSFLITAATRKFQTPAIQIVSAGIPQEHPRVLVQKKNLLRFRTTAIPYKETALIIKEANGYLNKPAPKESITLPTFTGKDDLENEKIAVIAGKFAGRDIQKLILALSQAYVLTGDTIYAATARDWMLAISTWDPNGPSSTSNFGDGSIMSSLAIGVDTFWDLLSPSDRKKIIQQVTVRAKKFYAQWIGQVESRSSSMHVWQHIMHNLLQTSLALQNEVPEAKKWLEYIYEIWIAQSPKMAEEDGAWFNGTAYFGMNTLTLIDIPYIFNSLTGVDFMGAPWFKNNPRWLTYSFPPNSISDGLCNDGDKYAAPNINYAGYTDALARLLNDPYAAWYSKTIANSVGKDIAEDPEFRWFRLQKGLQLKLPVIAPNLKFPEAAIFPEIGVAYMHTSVQNAKTNLMLSLRSSPFASLSHTHADQNTFNIAYGGKRLFYNSGYRPAMGDPHFLAWYKHTQGHNGILIDGNGQPFSDGSYGLIPRFLHGEQISYAVGDASKAYAGMVEGEKVNHGMQLYKRHYIMLRPSIIIIYDELEADHTAQWTWLLHNDKSLMIDSVNKTISAQNEAAKAQVSLFASSPINFKVTDQFSVPVNNWTNKISEEGDTLNYVNQWHFKGETQQKTTKMRYLAIIQVKPDGHFEQIVNASNQGIISIGHWRITAEMDTTKPAKIQLHNTENTVAFVSSGTLSIQQKKYHSKDDSSAKLVELIKGKTIYQEAYDSIPASIKKMFIKSKSVTK